MGENGKKYGTVERKNGKMIIDHKGKVWKAMQFIDKRTNEVKNAYSIEVDNEKVLVQFQKDGKTYTYNADNIEIVTEPQEKKTNRIYHFKRPCYRCKKPTTIYTYITFEDNVNEDVTFPWDKKRLLKSQDVSAHILDPSIEYYGLNVIGENDALDKRLLEKFPDKIKKQYSATQKRSYPMNICEHCKAKQGEYFVFRCVNEMIKNMQEIEVLTDK